MKHTASRYAALARCSVPLCDLALLDWVSHRVPSPHAHRFVRPNTHTHTHKKNAQTGTHTHAYHKTEDETSNLSRNSEQSFLILSLLLCYVVSYCLCSSKANEAENGVVLSACQTWLASCPRSPVLPAERCAGVVCLKVWRGLWAAT